MHERDPCPCRLAHQLHNVDLLMTPHGFQSMLLVFLPRPAVLFEVRQSVRGPSMDAWSRLTFSGHSCVQVFPFKYFKRGYGPLSQEYGSSVYSVHFGLWPDVVWWRLYGGCRCGAQGSHVTPHRMEVPVAAVRELQLVHGLQGM